MNLRVVLEMFGGVKNTTTVVRTNYGKLAVLQLQRDYQWRSWNRDFRDVKPGKSWQR